MDLQLNADRFTGKEYLLTYQKFRPSPPVEIIHQALNYLNKEQAERILDLGCGTGISTRIWRKFARQIIGLDPSKEMIEIASDKNRLSPKIKYIVGYSNQVELPSSSVDIISCAQSFHWMEPNSTVSEINRLLKRNGVFVVYDALWPPSANFEFEQAYNYLFLKIAKITESLQETIAHRWNKNAHFEHLSKTGKFRFLKKVYYHKTQKFSKEQFMGIALSQGGLEALLKLGLSTEAIGLNHFKDEIDKLPDPIFNEITYHYQVIFGIKD